MGLLVVLVIFVVIIFELRTESSPIDVLVLFPSVPGTPGPLGKRVEGEAADGPTHADKPNI